MELKALLDRRPIVVGLAGPNGAGKSTFFEAHLANTGLYFVNADQLALALEMNAYAAAELADSLRCELVERRESFIFETVFSDPTGDKLKFLKQVEESGYTVLLIFIGVSDSGISGDRVAIRVSQGGHDVPSQKLLERFPRIMNNLKKAFAELANLFVFDHSDLDQGYRLVAVKTKGREIELRKPVPDWLRALLP